MLNKLSVYLQYMLPQHGLSRLAGHLAQSRLPWLKNWLIQRFIKQYQIDMSQALISDPAAYVSFNDFFTRQLKPGLRPPATGNCDILSPADGTVAAAGKIAHDTLVQAKGMYYSLASLTGDDPALYQAFIDGHYATVYLAPHNYHRVHMPITGQLQKTLYLPGNLFSVNKITSSIIPTLFARNERLICLFSTEAGPMAVILVGALIVGSIQTVWMDTPIRSHGLQSTDYPNGPLLKKGEELGHFQLGSTVILLFSQGSAAWSPTLLPGASLEYGQQIGNIIL